MKKLAELLIETPHLKIGRAFQGWLIRTSGGDPERAADLLAELIPNATNDSVVWELLKATKDEIYNRETFIKAAKLILDKVPE